MSHPGSPLRFSVSSPTIDGSAVAGDGSFDVINPATGRAFLTAPTTSPALLDTAFEAAVRAFRPWSSDEDGRRSALRRAADVLAADEDIAPLLTMEQGKPLEQARMEVQGTAGWLRYYADLELGREIIQEDDSTLVEVVRRPLGPVAVITPWNYPLFLAAAKIGPALRAGNTVVLKPSPYTPLTSLRLGEILRDVFPPGVFNVVNGGDELGAAMSAHPLARKITFTGSTAVGKKIAAAAAPDLKRLTLELGGNDPAIVLDDADIESTARALFERGFINNGQSCIAPKRVYAARSVLPRLADALAELARGAKVGDGMLPGTELGPLNNRAQVERVTDLVSDAIAHGATPLAGGTRIEGPGFFYAPTILTGVDDGVRIVDEEQFGPVLPLVAYGDVDEAVARANATQFGLGASVWGTDTDRAATVAEQLDAGMVWINGHTEVAYHFPFPGAKWSALGVEGGRWGLEAFGELKMVHRRKAPARRA
ncbi:aldehyde dehydrogenase family protein [Streptomyces sp. ME01-24h]|nr:aldehyde dehydrogenase family protein [Streptomyces sp. ME19-03-3]MDX3353550.1 aldehyde dehydrogenase family protein [Streptomyces sp. ME01-24h]